MQLFTFPETAGSLLQTVQDHVTLPAWLSVLSIVYSDAGVLPAPDGAFRGELQSWLREAAAFVAAHRDPEQPFCFYGSHFGGWIALELAYQLFCTGREVPLHLFLSSLNAPHVTYPNGSLVSFFPSVSLQQEPLPCRISVFAGKQDVELAFDRLGEWSRYSSRRCDIHILKGGAAVWREDPEELFRSLSYVLMREYAENV